MWLQVTNKVVNKIEITHQGEGHIKVNMKVRVSEIMLCFVSYSLEDKI